MRVLGLGALWKVSVTDAEAGNGLAGPRDGSSPPGSHGDLGAVGGAQVLIVEAAPHAPPQRVGPAVRLVSKICGESGGGQSAARPARAHTHTRRRDKAKSCWKPVKAACVGREGTFTPPEQKAADTDEPFHYAPKQRVILVEAMPAG